MQTQHQIAFGNAMAMKAIPSESIDLVVTSPPYPMIAMWDDIFVQQAPDIGSALRENNGSIAFELMHRVLDPIWLELFRVMKKGATACINIGDATRTINDVFCLYPNHTRIAASLRGAGFLSLPCILWRKQTNAPNKFMGSGMLPAGAYVTLEHEYVLIFRKGAKREFRSAEDARKRRESAFFWEERNHWFSDVWMDLKGASQTLFTRKARNRSAAFPFELPYRLINMFSVKEDTILDPFLGIGTTMFAAMASGRNSVGIELFPEFEKDIALNLPKIAGFTNDRIHKRLNDHIAFVEQRKQDKREFKHQNRPYDFPVVSLQERDLFFNELLRVREKGKSRFRVEYADGPGNLSRAYWGALFNPLGE